MRPGPSGRRRERHDGERHSWARRLLPDARRRQHQHVRVLRLRVRAEARRERAGGGMTTLQRSTFATSRESEFFTEKELTMQFGAPKVLWPLMTVKELIDNALDATEATDVPPEIAITLEQDSIVVRDNGPGLPESTVDKALNYNLRVEDKRHYISSSRGQLGNALKCVI